MKTIGIIGGLGPETTSEFYLKLIFKSYQIDKTQRPPVLMWSIPMEYKIEEDLIQRSTGEERYIPFLIDAAKRLESGGADFIVIPCNSVHIFIEEIRSAVKIPVLSIVEETSKFLQNNNVESVGLLATQTTVKTNLYQLPLEQNGIKVVLPTKENQAEIGALISRLVLSRNGEEDKQELIKIIEDFKQFNVNTVVLACTDLQLLMLHRPKLRIYDTMKIFADATIREILKN